MKQALIHWWRNYQQLQILRRHVRDKQRERFILESVSLNW